MAVVTLFHKKAYSCVVSEQIAGVKFGGMVLHALTDGVGFSI